MGYISRMGCYHFINILGHTNSTSNINVNFFFHYLYQLLDANSNIYTT